MERSRTTPSGSPKVPASCHPHPLGFPHDNVEVALAGDSHDVHQQLTEEVSHPDVPQQINNDLVDAAIGDYRMRRIMDWDLQASPDKGADIVDEPLLPASIDAVLTMAP